MKEHEENVVFLDHAGSSRPSDAVVKREYRHLRLEQAIGGYAAADAVVDEVVAARNSLGRLVGASGDLVALGESSSVLWSRALNMASLKPHSKVVVTSYEYGSNLIALAALAGRHDLSIEVVEANQSGELSVGDFAEAVEKYAPSLVALCHIPTSLGITIDVQFLASIAKPSGAIVFVDACQSVGQVDTTRLMEEADFVVCSGRKFIAGPRGTGFAALSPSFADQLQLADADISGARLNENLQVHIESPLRLLERWEGNVSGILGLGIAAQETLALGGAQEYERRVRLIEMLRMAMQSLKCVRILEPDVGTCSTATFVVDGISPTDVVALCRAEGALISDVETYTAPLDLPRRIGGDVNRVSLGPASTEADVQTFVTILERITSTVR